MFDESGHILLCKRKTRLRNPRGVFDAGVFGGYDVDGGRALRPLPDALNAKRQN